MKYNLKNRHKCTHGDRLLCTCCSEIKIWFEGFEKELREKIENAEAWYHENQLNILSRFELHSQDGIAPEELLIFFIEHILGENKE